MCFYAGHVTYVVYMKIQLGRERHSVSLLSDAEFADKQIYSSWTNMSIPMQICPAIFSCGARDCQTVECLSSSECRVRGQYF